MFLDVYTASHGALPTLPHLGPLAVALDRNWNSGDPVKPPQAPALVCCLCTLPTSSLLSMHDCMADHTWCFHAKYTKTMHKTQASKSSINGVRTQEDDNECPCCISTDFVVAGLMSYNMSLHGYREGITRHGPPCIVA